ncbi:helix-turn-helix transcriptional regulator [Rhodococcus tukisamuensis]|uniref:Autoinducer binding domain-containing protein n=1 Tax=Rhodococcus tukisamuensis TaxID=168276 RepID=A0A1G6X5P6_9NOCA|nr:helix-turn-helix transcriptional regulator [Rhodococcus tukisamuensis]SDD72606.1 Autoinducer binding domain-containing protein [Rhodococcus tukisamuensis]
MANSIRWWTRFAEEVRAAGHGDLPVSAPVRTARDGLGFDCAALMGHGFDGHAGAQPVLVNIDYPSDVIDFIASVYARSCPGHDYALRHPVAMRFVDLPFDFHTTRTYREVLQPNGFHEGLTLPLVVDAGGTVRPGFVAMSSTHARPLDDDARLALTMLSSELAGLIDPGAEPEDTSAELVVWVKGDSVDVRVGTLDGAALSTSDLRRLARLAVADGGVRAGLHQRGADGQWWRVRVVARSGAALVRIGRADVLGGLTARELDVVGLVARGWSNERVSEALGISVRTARSHIESALAKVGVSNRTALARAAFEHDLDSFDALRCAAKPGLLLNPG